MAIKARVWFVETGSYSDYRVVAVCSSASKAQRIRAMISDASVRAVCVDPIAPSRDGLRLYGLAIDDDGSITDDWRVDYLREEDLLDPQPTRAWISRKNYHETTLRLRVWTWTKSKAQARKIAGDIRRALMASGDWRSSFVGEERAIHNGHGLGR